MFLEVFALHKVLNIYTPNLAAFFFEGNALNHSGNLGPLVARTSQTLRLIQSQQFSCHPERLWSHPGWFLLLSRGGSGCHGWFHNHNKKLGSLDSRPCKGLPKICQDMWSYWWYQIMIRINWCKLYTIDMVRGNMSYVMFIYLSSFNVIFIFTDKCMMYICISYTLFTSLFQPIFTFINLS